jgi:hypothetical protein
MDIYDYENLIKVMPKRKKKIKIPKEILDSGLDIKALPTLKHNIKQKKLMDMNVIPKHPSRCIYNGKSGSGKSNLLINMMVKKEFYKGYFDEVYLISPTANKADDLPKYLGLDEKNMFNELDPEIIQKILDNQVKKVEEKGVDKAPKVAVILDDIQSSPAFMRSNPFTQLFIAGRHYSISVFVCCQQFKRLPKVCRLQASNIFFFPSSLSEVETLCDEFCPPNMSKKDFKEMIKYATNEPYQFLHINMFCHFKDRYRKNLDEVLELVD